jgi:hypothetical protein
MYATDFIDGKWFKNDKLSKEHNHYYHHFFLRHSKRPPWCSYLYGVSPNYYCDYLDLVYSPWRIVPQ